MTPGDLVAQLGRIVNGLEITARRSASITAERGRRALVRVSPVFDGIFRAGWRSMSNVGSDILATIENDAPHAGIIEKGARPHPVSAEGRAALRRWVIRKGLLQVKNRKGVFNPITTRQVEKNDDIEQEVTRVVDAICRKIAREGQKGLHLVENMLPYIEWWFAREHERQMQQVLKEVRTAAKASK